MWVFKMIDMIKQRIQLYVDKKKLTKKALSIFALIFTTSLLSANESFIDTIDYENDVSMRLLISVLGPLVTLPEGIEVPETLLSYIMVALLPLINVAAIMIASVLVYFSTLSSAGEGTIFGKKWTNSTTPVRIGFGLFLLFPDENGFALIQKIFMYFVIAGISLANTLWDKVIDNYEAGNILNNRLSITAEQLINENDSYVMNDLLKRFFVNALDLKQKQQVEGFSDLIYALPPSNEYDLNVEYVSDNPVQQPSIPRIFETEDLTDEQKEDIQNYAFALVEFGNQMLQDPLIIASSSQLVSSNPDLLTDETGLAYPDSYLAAWFFEKRQLLDSLLTKIDNPNSANIEDKMRGQGWFMAGTFYWRLQSRATQEANALTSKADFGRNISDQHSKEIEGFRLQKILQLWQKILDSYEDLANSVPESEAKSLPQGVGNISVTFKEAFDPQGNSSDPLALFILYCTQKIYSWLLYAVIILPGPFLAFSTVLFYIVGKDLTLPFVTFGLMVLLTAIAVFLSVSVMFMTPLLLGAYYLPMIPFIIFILAALAWGFKVLEAILAAPVVAISLLEPSDNDFGRASQSGVMILNIALRPALLLIGFIFAARIIGIGMDFAAYPVHSFSLLKQQDTVTYILMDIAKAGIIVAYVQVIVTRCFSLIYVLPDKVFSWIGGQRDPTDVNSVVQEINQNVVQGVQVLESYMKIGEIFSRTVMQAANAVTKAQGEKKK